VGPRGEFPRATTPHARAFLRTLDLEPEQ
jgi:hypothetical protein